MYPVSKNNVVNLSKNPSVIEFEFTGTGFALRGAAIKKKNNLPEYVFQTELYIDGKKIETATLPTSYTTRRYELFWKYQLPETKHSVKIIIKNPSPDYEIQLFENLVYTSKSHNH
jgi:hypothetical protein